MFNPFPPTAGKFWRSLTIASTVAATFVTAGGSIATAADTDAEPIDAPVASGTSDHDRGLTLSPGDPVVARVEMRLSADDTVDVIEKGDLLTLVRERDDDYVIVTHDGTRGAVDKVNAVPIAESVDIYSELIEQSPDEGRYRTLRASAHWSLGETEAAIEDFDRAIELGYEKSHAYTSRGLFHAEMGSFEKAIADYDRALELEPESVAPIANRAAVHMRRGDYRSAIADYTAVLDARPDDAAILHQRAIAHKAAGDFDAAASDFTTLVTARPDDRVAIMGRGYVYFAGGKFAEAAQDFSAAIDLYSDDPVAWNNRVHNLAQTGDHATAIDDYQRAIRLAPTYALAHQNLAWSLATAPDQSLRDPAAAVSAARRAAELNNHQNVSDLAALAASLAAAGEFDEAVGWQEKVVEMIDPTYRGFASEQLRRYQNEQPFAPEEAGR